MGTSHPGDGQGSPLGGLVVHAELSFSAAQARDEALAQLAFSESLEVAYRAWSQLREQRQMLGRRVAEARARLDAQGRFLVGAVRAAGVPRGGPSGSGLEPGSAVTQDALGREAEFRLTEARRALEAQRAHELSLLEAALGQAKAEVVRRVERALTVVHPKLELWHRPLAGGERAVLQLSRVSPDESVLVCRLLTGKLPTRHDFLFDEATDDVLQGPPALYPDEGVAPEEVRRGPLKVRALLEADGDVLPVRGHIPWRVGGALYRLLQRGPVMEVEVASAGAESEAYRSVLTREEAERFAGALLQLRLEGKLLLELRTG